jgi:hypothetical protein
VVRFEDIDNRFIKPYLNNASELMRASGDSGGGGGEGGNGSNGNGSNGGGGGGDSNGNGGAGGGGGGGGEGVVGELTPVRVTSVADLRDIALEEGEGERTPDATAAPLGLPSSQGLRGRNVLPSP